jgi:hypothetical protein
MATRFVETHSSQTGALSDLADRVNEVAMAALLERTAGAITLTAAQLINGVVLQTGTPGAFNMTTPTATEILAGLQNAQIGSKFEFTLRNGGDATITIVAGSGVTLKGVTAVPTSKTQTYIGVVTAVDTPAVAFIGKQFAPI